MQLNRRNTLTMRLFPDRSMSLIRTAILCLTATACATPGNPELAKPELVTLNVNVDQTAVRTVAVLGVGIDAPAALIPVEQRSGADDMHRVASTALTAFLSGELLAMGYDVVERAKLDEVLKEMQLQGDSIIDPDTAAEVGRILGVDGVVLGEVAAGSAEFAVGTFKLLQVQTARVMWLVQCDNEHTIESGFQALRGRLGR